MTRLQGRIAVVTGGASGIGRACAFALAAEGAEVIIADIDSQAGVDTSGEIAATGGKAHAVHLDVTSEEGWKQSIATVGETFGALHVLVNNAGICISQHLLQMSFASWRRQIAVNLDSLFLGTRAALPLIQKSGGGSIVNMSSVAGLRGVSGMSGYCATKAGVRLFTKAVALECAQARNNVRVNSIHPGAIETEIWLKLGNDGVLPTTDARRNVDDMAAIRAAGAAATPMGHAGVPSDIASGVVFLASDESAFITGTELVIDGGVMAG
jgi:NAD(P)-dependent dehydrogenase (short-subunit alcohol dehydrogenase family)